MSSLPDPNPSAVARNLPAIHRSEEAKIKGSVFAAKDALGAYEREYILHASIQEVSNYADLVHGPGSQKKARTIIVGSTKFGKLEVYKAKESGSAYLVGRTWLFAELTNIELVNETGVVATIGKKYYWDLIFPEKRQKFVDDLTAAYQKGFSRQLPVNKHVAAPQQPPSRERTALEPSLVTSPLRSPARELASNRTNSSPQSIPAAAASLQSSSRGADSRQNSPSFTHSKLGVNTLSPRAYSSPLSQSFSSNDINSGAKTEQPPFASTAALKIPARSSNTYSPRQEIRPISQPQSLPSRGGPEAPEPRYQSQSQHGSPAGALNVKASLAASIATHSAGSAVTGSSAGSGLQSAQLRNSNPILQHPELREISRDSNARSSRRNSPLMQAPLRHSGHTLNRSEQTQIEQLKQEEPRSSAASRDRSPFRPRNLRVQTDKETNNVTNDDEPYTPQDSAILAKRLSGNFGQSPRGFRYEYKSPRRKTHHRNGSGASINSRNETNYGNLGDFMDLSSALNEIGWNGGEMSAQELESTLSKMVGNMREEKVEKFMAVSDKAAELERTTQAAILNANSLDATLNYINLQLETIGREVSNIEGQGETNQVEAMNRKLLLKELEKLLDTIRLPTDLIQYLGTAAISIENLPNLEQSLCELYSAVQAAGITNSTSENNNQGMMAAEDQRDLIAKTADSFSARAVQYLVRLITETIQAHAPSEKTNVELSERLYPFTGIILFIKDTSNDGFSRLVKSFTEQSCEANNYLCSQMVERTKSRISQLTGDVQRSLSSKKSDLQQGHANSSTSALMARARRVNSRASHSNSTKSYALSNNRQSQLVEEFVNFVNTIAGYLCSEQELVSLIFHYSSTAGENYIGYTKSHPIEERLHADSVVKTSNYNVVDASRSRSRELRTMVSKLFPNIQDLLEKVSGFIKSCCMLESIALVGALEAALAEWSATNLEFTKSLLAWFRDDIVKHWNAFIDEQARQALQVEVVLKFRIGIVPVVSQFVTYVEITEKALRLLKQKNIGETRRLLDDSHDKLYRSLNQVFESFTHEPNSTNTGVSSLTLGPNEDKELLNSHITKIENLDLIVTNLSEINSEAAANIVLQARNRYKADLQAYLDEVLTRPLGHAIELLLLVKATADPRRKQKPSAIRKAASDFESKELRKNIDLLKKRVKKHFTSDEEPSDLRLFDKVWRALTAEFLSYYNQVSTIAHNHEMDSVMEINKAEMTEMLR